MVKKGDTFRIGEICPESGVYRLKNCSCASCGCKSKEQQTIPLVKGKKFPPCKNCKNKDVVWEFERQA